VLIAYNLGAGPYAIISMMVDDITKIVLQNDFKIDTQMEFRRYTMLEMSKKLGYKNASGVFAAVKRLHRAKLIKMYRDKTISLIK
jgi:hypothetical protein